MQNKMRVNLPALELPSLQKRAPAKKFRILKTREVQKEGGTRTIEVTRLDSIPGPTEAEDPINQLETFTHLRRKNTEFNFDEKRFELMKIDQIKNKKLTNTIAATDKHLTKFKRAIQASFAF